MVADCLAQNSPKFFRPIYQIGPKIWDVLEKKASSVVRDKAKHQDTKEKNRFRKLGFQGQVSFHWNLSNIPLQYIALIILSDYFVCTTK